MVPAHKHRDDVTDSLAEGRVRDPAAMPRAGASVVVQAMSPFVIYHVIDVCHVRAFLASGKKRKSPCLIISIALFFNARSDLQEIIKIRYLTWPVELTCVLTHTA
jgi:hypothetical protein